MKFNPKNLVIITGASGVGKTTVAIELLKKHKNIKRVITYTTRKKRKSERDGKDYNFITTKEFKEMIKKNKFFEWAEVYGNYYGNSKDDLKNLCKKNKYCVMILDIQGAEKIKREVPNSIGIFVWADFEELAKRIEKRGKMKRKDFELRQKIAKNEIKKAKQFDYMVKNESGKMEKAVEKIEKILDL